MYDYITIQSDSDHSQSISVAHFRDLLTSVANCNLKSNASFYYEIEQYRVHIRGIKCDSNGSYSFNSDSHFTEINLIEIDIPWGGEYDCDQGIRKIANYLAAKTQWQIDWRECD